MGEPSKSPTQNNYHGILGIPISASLTDIGKAYKSLVMKWHPDRNPSNKAEAEAKFSTINEAYKSLSIKMREEENSNNGKNETKTLKKKKSKDHRKDGDNDEEKDEEFHISTPTLLSRTTSRICPMPSPRSMTPPAIDLYASVSEALSGGNTPKTPTTPSPSLLSRAPSQRNPTPIFFSQSAMRRKPPPIEKKLECTLEELCHGCVKKIKITRDAISTNGLILQEEEILMINVKPGWRKGTKITFEGKGDERPGTLPADIIFAIDEKRHPMFKRGGDDLQLGVRVPLIQALTGCTISVPLLGGGQVNVSVDDIIYSGYEKIVPGQGMPKSKERGRRGDLRLNFLVDFPSQLSNEQRSEVVRILDGCS